MNWTCQVWVNDEKFPRENLEKPAEDMLRILIAAGVPPRKQSPHDKKGFHFEWKLARIRCSSKASCELTLK